jgi:hypothetical protein
MNPKFVMRKESNKMVFNYFFTFKFLVVELVPSPTPIEPWVNPRTLHTLTMVPLLKVENRKLLKLNIPS